DPGVTALDPRFRQCIAFNAPLQRLYSGTLWAEGPAWNGVGRYLVWSDIPSNRQLRWIEDDGRVTHFREPSGHSNGNTFDFQGRQLSAEHGGRRVLRYEADGRVSVIADRYQGRRLNSPNDLVVHPDGGIWFTDPSFGIRSLYEGEPAESETPEAVYRVDPVSGRVDLVNVWGGASPGVTVLSPEGDLIGMIRLPEICANLCFGGAKRNRLFMTASQSLYALHLTVPGAHIC